MTETVTDKLVRGGLWLGGARFLVHVLQVIGTIVAAWFLSPSDYGLVGIALTVMLILSTITSMQLGEALVRRGDDVDAAVHTVWTLGLLRGLILAAILIAVSRPFADFYDDPRLAPILQVLAFAPLATSLSNPRRFLKQRALEFRFEVVFALAQKLTATVVTIAIAVIYQSYWALVIGAVAEQAVGAVLSYVMIRYRPRFSLVGVRSLFGFSIWLTLGQLVNALNYRVEILMIGKVLGAAPLGVYRMGSTLAQTPIAALMAPVRQVLYPGLSRVMRDPAAQNDPTRMCGPYQRAQALTTALALPVGVGFALVADPLVRLALDERWRDVTFILQYLAAVFAFQTLGSLSQPLAMAMDRTRLLFIRDTQLLLLRVPIIAIGLYAAGLQGVVLARIISGAVGVTINLGLVRHLIGLPILEQIKANTRPVVSVAIMAAAVWLVSTQLGGLETRPELAVRIAIEVAAGCVSYFGAMAALWLAAGRPDGPEAEVMRLARPHLLRLRARLS